MNAISREQLLNQLNWRYATKQFDPRRKIGPEDWAALEEALVLTPSSFGLQPWRFIVVTDQTIKDRLVAASWGQRQVADCSHLVVFAIKKDLAERDVDAYLDWVAKVRSVPRASLANLREMMIGNLFKRLDGATRRDWAAHQVYIALGNFLNSAALLGVDACPMEGIDREQYDKVLGLENQGLVTVVACASGYRAASDKYASLKKVRFPKQEVLLEV